MFGVLLSADTASFSQVLTACIGAAIIVGIFILLYNKNYSKNEAALNEFLDKIENIVKQHIIELIENIDINNIKESFIVFQSEFFGNLYNDIYDLCLEELEKYDKVAGALIKKVLTKEKIEDYVHILIEDGEIQDKLADLYNAIVKDKVDDIVLADELLAEEVAKYEEDVETNDESVEELDPMVGDALMPPVEENIIPPTEEESDTVKDDGTIEILDEDITDEL